MFSDRRHMQPHLKPTPFDTMFEYVESVTMEGPLEKKGKFKTWSWSKYWFVLRRGSTVLLQRQPGKITPNVYAVYELSVSWNK